MILTTITEHERFWLDVIRIASRETDPAPTLERTQKLRRLFSEDAVTSRPEHNDGR